MGDLKLEHGDWILVCDGRKALILENVGNPRQPKLRTRDVREHALPATRDLGTDAPGRAFSSVGSIRSATEQTDWHQQEEERFLIRLTAELEAAVISGKLKHVAIVAPPRALGVLRRAYPASLSAAVTAELPHDYVNLPVDEIARHLFG